ncbi:MAG: glycoside hydrolase family 43 protein [Candidatus Azobacteroides sp.]|nr:glycoside hydrolase family 43 protein [Candidatus Azobacteroides sp.]
MYITNKTYSLICKRFQGRTDDTHSFFTFCFLLVIFSCTFFSCGSNKKLEDLIINDRHTNPLDVAFGDPFILHASDGKFYMYGTSGEQGFRAYSSDDLTDWVDEGMVYEGATPESWATDRFVAPEVYERNGTYYLFFSATWKENPNQEAENFRIGVAVSNKPTGPFKEMYARPVFDPGYSVIDANVYFDDENEKVYLYYSRCCHKHPVESEISEWVRRKKWYDEIEEGWIYGVEMKPDFSGIIGEPVVLVRPPVSRDDKQAEWESRSVTAVEINCRSTAGSFIFKKNDIYYMMYSANFFGGQYYAVGYATSDSPLGPFTKSEDNPVLQKNSLDGGIVTGTGHNMVLELPDGQMYCVYHGRTEETGSVRLVFIDRMEIRPDGKLVVYGPTTHS